MVEQPKIKTTKKPVNPENDRPFTKSQFMSDLKKASRRLTDAPSDRHPDKPEPTK